jgi:hypothetical protein
MLLERHGGAVPSTFEALEALPGVGHKTASVVMAQAFGWVRGPLHPLASPPRIADSHYLTLVISPCTWTLSCLLA